MGEKTLLLLLLAASAALEMSVIGSRHHGRHHGGSMPGSLSNISRDDRSLQQVVLAAAYSFNNQSNDAFLFKPSAIHRAQRQIVKGIRYIVDLDISRTVCRKRDDNNDLSQCRFQPEGRLHQVFQCHSVVWVIPWRHETNIQIFFCRNGSFRIR
ncbi:cystatin-F isoform X2 [Hippoglossus hippoglossus]|uniref:cystatin-F n=1 Tax=Hippoglossus stenolepis TaxID=195615 RepID=UPI00148D13F1|nr:cystatin-F isoform X2 [Hippoglossus hippoglossus]XP_035028660.1 cystatin-F [Hippoglossus stenolepis]XP_047198326.1 cystatin-F [Hippoglossus stenolepis]